MHIGKTRDHQTYPRVLMNGSSIGSRKDGHKLPCDNWQYIFRCQTTIPIFPKSLRLVKNAIIATVSIILVT